MPHFRKYLLEAFAEKIMLELQSVWPTVTLRTETACALNGRVTAINLTTLRFKKTTMRLCQ